MATEISFYEILGMKEARIIQLELQVAELTNQLNTVLQAQTQVPETSEASSHVPSEAVEAGV